MVVEFMLYMTHPLNVLCQDQNVLTQMGNREKTYKGTVLYITQNSALKGEAIYLEVYSKISIQNDRAFGTSFSQSAVSFIGSSAQYGGAIYVDDATNFGICETDLSVTKSSNSECFISVSISNLTTDTNFSLN